jgi:hypothetical protein
MWDVTRGGAGKQKDMEFLGKSPLPKKGRGEQFLQFKKKGGTSTSSRQDIDGKSGSDQTRSKAIAVRGPNDSYIYRGEGHKWKTCQYLGRGCHHCGEKVHFKRECL